MTDRTERLNVHDATWKPFPEFGGRLAKRHENADGGGYRRAGAADVSRHPVGDRPIQLDA